MLLMYGFIVLGPTDGNGKLVGSVSLLNSYVCIWELGWWPLPGATLPQCWHMQALREPG